MKFAKQIERLQYLDKLIRKGSTGTPDELADRIGVSRSQLYNLIGYLNDIGMMISYSRSKNSFYYDCSNKNLEINFSIKIITEQNAYTIYGGGTVSFLHNKMTLKSYDQIYF